MSPLRLPGSFLASTVPRLCTDSKATETVIATIVDSEVSLNDLKGIPPVSSMTAFHSLSAPSIHIRDYVHRLASYTFSSTTCLIAALYYVRTAVQREPKLAPSSLSVHRLLITALVLAAKFFDDVTYSMSYYAKVGGLSVKELAYLELKLLQILDFRLHISSADFQTLENDLLALSNPDIHNTSQYKSCASHAQPLYCEAHHPDDSVGLWVHHPNPSAHILDSLVRESEKCARYEQPNLMSMCSTASSGEESDRRDRKRNVAVRPPKEVIFDEGSGPLVRYTSSTSTVTSEGSMSTEGGMCSDGGSEDATMNTPNWNSCINNGGANANNYRTLPTPDVYCRFRGPINSQQWQSNQPLHPQHHQQHHSYI